MKLDGKASILPKPLIDVTRAEACFASYKSLACLTLLLWSVSAMPMGTNNGDRRCVDEGKSGDAESLLHSAHAIKDTFFSFLPSFKTISALECSLFFAILVEGTERERASQFKHGLLKHGLHETCCRNELVKSISVSFSQGIMARICIIRSGFNNAQDSKGQPPCFSMTRLVVATLIMSVVICRCY